MSGLSGLAWTAVIGQSQVVTTLTAPLLPTNEYSATKATLDLYSDYISAAGSCRASVNNLLKSAAHLSDTLSTTLTAFSQGLSTLLAAHEGPDLPDDSLIQSTKAVDAAAFQLLSDFKSGKAIDESGLQAILAAATISWTGTSNSALRLGLSQAASMIFPLYQSLSVTIEKQCLVVQGKSTVLLCTSRLHPQ